MARLRAEGVRRYHDQHPFHQRMHAGTLSRAELQAWTLNRYYYQTRIPIKDAIIVSKSEDPAFRRSLDPAHPRPRRRRARQRGAGAVAAAGRGGGARARRGRELPPGAPGRPLRLRLLRRALPRESAGRGGGVVADRDVCPRPDVQADRGLGAALPLGRRRGAGLLPRAGAARAARRRGRAGVRGRKRDLARAAGGLRRGAGAQDGDPLAPGRLRAGGHGGRRARQA